MAEIKSESLADFPRNGCNPWKERFATEHSRAEFVCECIEKFFEWTGPETAGLVALWNTLEHLLGRPIEQIAAAPSPSITLPRAAARCRFLLLC